MKFFFLTFLLLLPEIVIGGIRPTSSDLEEQLADSDTMIERALMKINRWGYTIRDLPGPNDGPMTYRLHGSFVLNNRYLRSIEEAQELYIELYRLALQQMNQIRIIRPWLASFPLTPETFELYLLFKDRVGKNMSGEYFASILLQQNNLRFARFTPDIQNALTERPAKEIEGLKDLYTPICPRSPVTQKQTIPRRFFNTWRYNSPQAKEEISFLRERCRETELSLIVVGSVGKREFDSRALNFALCGTQKLSLEAAKQLASEWVQYTVQYSQNSQLYKDLIKWRYDHLPKDYPFPEPVPQYIAFRISFWDEYIDRPVAPYIAEIRLLDEKLSYFTADDNQRLVLTFEESFAEALARQTAVEKSEAESG